MLRRFSTTFKKSKGDRESKQNQNGAQVNGTKRQSKMSSGPISSSDEDQNETPEDGVSVFDKYAQVLHASQRPLPNQTGDGTYLDKEHSGSLFQDVRALGFRDVGTVRDIVKTKAKGEHTDDKTMLMERIIQVSQMSKQSAVLGGFDQFAHA